MADDEHNGGPLEGDVEGVFAGGYGFGDGLGGFVDVGELVRAGHGGGHGGFDGAGLDGEDGDAFAVDAVAEAGEEGVEAGFRGSVEVVGFAAAVAGYGRDDGEGAGVTLDAEIGEPGEERDGGHEVGVQNLGGDFEILFSGGLIAEDAVGEVGNVHAGEGVDGVGEERGVFVGVVKVGDGGVDVGGAASFEIGGDGGELGGVASNQEKRRAFSGPDAAGGFGDAGGGAEDEDFARSGAVGRSMAARGGGVSASGETVKGGFRLPLKRMVLLRLVEVGVFCF